MSKGKKSCNQCKHKKLTLDVHPRYVCKPGNLNTLKECYTALLGQDLAATCQYFKPISNVKKKAVKKGQTKKRNK